VNSPQFGVYKALSSPYTTGTSPTPFLNRESAFTTFPILIINNGIGIVLGVGTSGTSQQLVKYGQWLTTTNLSAGVSWGYSSAAQATIEALQSALTVPPVSLALLAGEMRLEMSRLRAELRRLENDQGEEERPHTENAPVVVPVNREVWCDSSSGSSDPC